MTTQLRPPFERLRTRSKPFSLSLFIFLFLYLCFLPMYDRIPLGQLPSMPSCHLVTLSCSNCWQSSWVPRIFIVLLYSLKYSSFHPSFITETKPTYLAIPSTKYPRVPCLRACTRIIFSVVRKKCEKGSVLTACRRTPSRNTKRSYICTVRASSVCRTARHV